MKKIIDITGVDPIIFVGLNDNNIKILENHFNSKIVVEFNAFSCFGLLIVMQQIFSLFSIKTFL